MRRKPSRAERSRAASTRGSATPLNAASAQPNPMPSHSMRAILAMLELASGSLVPRPTTTRRVSERPPERPSGSATAIRAAAASSSFGSIPRSRPRRTSMPGLAAMKLFISHGRSFLTWLAANSMPGIARMRRAPRDASAARPSPIVGRANSRYPVAKSLPGSRCARRERSAAAASSNSPTASGSRLPCPHSSTAVSLMPETPAG